MQCRKIILFSYKLTYQLSSVPFSNALRLNFPSYFPCAPSAPFFTLSPLLWPRKLTSLGFLGSVFQWVRPVEGTSRILPVRRRARQLCVWSGLHFSTKTSGLCLFSTAIALAKFPSPAPSFRSKGGDGLPLLLVTGCLTIPDASLYPTV